jgi:hypothetical protein
MFQLDYGTVGYFGYDYMLTFRSFLLTRCQFAQRVEHTQI